MPVDIPIQMTTTHQNRFWSWNNSDNDAGFLAGAIAVGNATLASATPSSFAASRRASALRPRDNSQRTNSGAIHAISREVTIGIAPVAATPRQPITGSRLAEIMAANIVPSATGTTIMLETNVRYLVGVISTTRGFWALTAAIDPKPTTKRSIENRIQAPSGISAHPAAPSEKIKPPPQIIFLRPIVSASRPPTSEPKMAPTPDDSSIIAPWP